MTKARARLTRQISEALREKEEKEKASKAENAAGEKEAAGRVVSEKRLGCDGAAGDELRAKAARLFSEEQRVAGSHSQFEALSPWKRQLYVEAASSSLGKK